MHKSRLYIFITIISILMIALISIQIVWLRNADKKTEEAFVLKVHKALSNIQQPLEQSTDCVQFFTKYHIAKGEGFYINKQKWSDAGFVGNIDTMDMYYDVNDYRSKPIHEIPYKYDVFKTSHPADIEMLIKIHYQFNDSPSTFSKNETAITRGNYLDVIGSGQSVADILDMDDVDSLIRSSLDKEGIDLDYGFGVMSKYNTIEYQHHISDSTFLQSSTYSIPLFTNNKFVNDHKLSIVFTQAGSSYSINYLLLLSVFIILLLTYAFYTFIRLYLRQNKLSEMKTDFINNLTHEFNTPMANISLALETIDDDKTEIEPKLKHILNIISNESQRLHNNIERALHVATIEKGALSLNEDIVDLAELLIAVEPSYSSQCEQLGGVFSMSFTGNCTIIGDETHLLNSICNLLDNAIKYRQESPEINIKAVELGKNITLEVSDNGKGMTIDTQKHIFDKFYRAHEGDMHNTKGFGLGLNYVKGIVDASGGHIEVWSKPGVGTKFTIYFPKNKTT